MTIRSVNSFQHTLWRPAKLRLPTQIISPPQAMIPVSVGHVDQSLEPLYSGFIAGIFATVLTQLAGLEIERP